MNCSKSKLEMDKSWFSMLLMLLVFVCVSDVLTFRASQIQRYKDQFIKKIGLQFEPKGRPKNEQIRGYLENVYKTLDKLPNTIGDILIYTLPKDTTKENMEDDEVSFLTDERLFQQSIGEAEIVIPDNDLSLIQEQKVLFELCATYFCVNSSSEWAESFGYLTFNITRAMIELIDENSNMTQMHLYIKSLNGTGSITDKASLVIHTVSKEFYSSIALHFPSHKRFKRENENTGPSASGQTVACDVKFWRFRFQDIGWQDWVIQPKYFDANICTGVCSLDVLDHNGNMSSHAFLRETYIDMTSNDNSQLIPHASCVPMKMSAVNILFQDKDGLAVKRMGEMIADTCGCY